MNRRQMLLGCTLAISCIYAAAFYFVFSYDRDGPSQTVLLQSDETMEAGTLYWLQAGVFKEVSSYEGLKEKLEDAGFTVYCVSYGELNAVVVEPAMDSAAVKTKMDAVIEIGVEVIEKSAALSKAQSEQVQNGQMLSVLKELYTP